MTEPTTEELVGMLTRRGAFSYVSLDELTVIRLAAKRLSDLEGKLGEARKALEWIVERDKRASSAAAHEMANLALEALKLTASGGGGDDSLSQGAAVAHPSVRPDGPHSAGGDP